MPVHAAAADDARRVDDFLKAMPSVPGPARYQSYVLIAAHLGVLVSVVSERARRYIRGELFCLSSHPIPRLT